MVNVDGSNSQNNIVREIRSRLGLSQSEMARALGVSPVTISRWENGRSEPSLMAQRRLFEVCGGNGLDLTGFIVDQRASRQGPSRSQFADGALTLYHASRGGIEGAIRPMSRARCDFGKGFYMGTDPLQPLTLVANEDRPVFYALSLDLAGLHVLDLGVGIDWALLIAYNRGYLDGFRESVVYERYAHMADGFDVVAGCIADDRMYQVLTDFFEQRITDAALLASLSALDLGRQYVAVTQRACERVRFQHEHALTGLELMFLRESATVRRREGVSLAERAAREHRRDGRYFDEILRDGSLPISTAKGGVRDHD